MVRACDTELLVSWVVLSSVLEPVTLLVEVQGTQLLDLLGGELCRSLRAVRHSTVSRLAERCTRSYFVS